MKINLDEYAPLYVSPEIRAQIPGSARIVVNPRTGRVGYDNGIDRDSQDDDGSENIHYITVSETLKKNALERILQKLLEYLKQAFRYSGRENENHPQYRLNDKQKEQLQMITDAVVREDGACLRPVFGKAAIGSQDMANLWPAGMTAEEACSGIIAAALARGEIVSPQEAYAAMYAKLDEMERQGANLTPQQSAFVQEMRLEDKQRDAMWAKPVPQPGGK